MDICDNIRFHLIFQAPCSPKRKVQDELLIGHLSFLVHCRKQLYPMIWSAPEGWLTDSMIHGLPTQEYGEGGAGVQQSQTLGRGSVKHKDYADKIHLLLRTDIRPYPDFLLDWDFYNATSHKTELLCCTYTTLCNVVYSI